MIRLLNIRYKHSSGEDRECSTLLLFANKREEDILWRKQLDGLCLSSPKYVHNFTLIQSVIMFISDLMAPNVARSDYIHSAR